MNVKSPATAADSVVSFVNVRKAYGRSVAVHDLNLDIGRGQFVTLLGPSGCGKSTTLRIVAGVDMQDSGRILVDGKLVCDTVFRIPPERRAIGMMFQDFALFPHLSVAENVAFGLEVQEVPKDKREAIRLRNRRAIIAAEYPSMITWW